MLEYTIESPPAPVHDGDALAATAAPTILKIRGEASYNTIDDFQAGLNRAVAMRPAQFTLDLAELTFISSIAIGALVTAARAIRQRGGTVGIINANPNVAETFQKCRLDFYLEGV